MQFYGLFGNPLGHSISPEIHEHIYKIAGIKAAYKKFEIDSDQLGQAIEAMKVLSIGGANVTIPYKEDFFPYLDELDPLAQRLHSVNTIKNTDGYFKGFNTDYAGIHLTFQRRGWQVAGQACYILGSGGASQTVAHYLQDQGASQVTMVSRDPSQVKNRQDWEYIDYQTLEGRSGQFLINGSPVGMYPKTEASPVSQDTISRFNYLFDMIYNPKETLFMKWGAELGKETANGLDMLVGQAIKAVEIWEDATIPEADVEAILTEFQENWEG